MESLLKQNDSDIANVFRLPEQLASIFGLLVSLPVVTTDMLMEKLGIAQPKMAIYRLRAHLMREFQISVYSAPRVGYWLDEATKERVRQMVER